MFSISVGIDASHETLAVSIDQARPFCVSNGKEGILALARKLPLGCQVHLEASGGCERLARRTLQELGHEVRVHNPLKTKRMAQARGVRAKTDPSDAVQLSRSGSLIPSHKPKSVEREELCDYSRMIDAMKTTLAEYRKRIQTPEMDKAAMAACSKLCKSLLVQIKEMEIAFAKRIKNSSLAKLYELALSIPSIGPQTARIIVCELPEDFEERTHGQISSYAGLAPIDNASGPGCRRMKCFYFHYLEFFIFGCNDINFESGESPVAMKNFISCFQKIGHSHFFTLFSQFIM